jgi:PAS domain S-box-containing protein
LPPLTPDTVGTNALAALFREHPEPLLLVAADPDLRILEGNLAAAAFYGYAPEALAEIALADLWAEPESVPTAADLDALAVRSGPSGVGRHGAPRAAADDDERLAARTLHGTVRQLGRDHQPRWVRLAARRVDANELLGPASDPSATEALRGTAAWLVSVRDMSEVEAARADAARSEHLYHMLAEHAFDGLALLASDLTNRSLAASTAKALGFRTLELEGKDRRDLIHPSDRKLFQDLVAQLAGRPGERAAITYRMRDAQGRWHWLDGAITNLVDDPDVGAFVLAYHDVSERMRALDAAAEQIAKLEQQVNHMQALRRVDMAITNAADVGLALDIFLEQVQQMLQVDAVGALLFDEHAATLQPAAARGFGAEPERSALVPLGQGPAGFAALEQRTIYIQDLQEDPRRGSVVDPLHQRRFRAYWAVPMLTKGQLVGVIELYAERAFVPDGQWFEFLETFADQGAIAVENALLFRSLERSNAELQLAYDKTIAGWAYALDLKDEETAGHSQRVTQMTVRLAQRVGVDQRDLVHIQRGALLHDIGKMGVPDSILLKRGALTPPERALIEQHTEYARDLLEPIDFLKPAIDIPYCHHERWDGTGYPRGLRGEEIPLAARIFAIVDVYDALTSERPYRHAWSREDTLEHIQKGAGKHFDPGLVEVFMTMIRDGDVFG